MYTYINMRVYISMYVYPWKVENYVRIDLSEVPLHMRDIVRLGLRYIVSLE